MELGRDMEKEMEGTEREHDKGKVTGKGNRKGNGKGKGNPNNKCRLYPQENHNWKDCLKIPIQKNLKAKMIAIAFSKRF